MLSRPKSKLLLRVIALIPAILLLIASALFGVFIFGETKPNTVTPEPPKIAKDAKIDVPKQPMAQQKIIFCETRSEEEPLPPKYGFTDEEIYLMAALLSGSKYVDGDGEYDIDYGNHDNYEQISLVLCVVMNRVFSEDSYLPNTVSEVIWQHNQFDAMKQWHDGLPEVSDISLQRVREWCEAYDAHDIGAQTIPEDHLYFCGNGYVNRSF